MPEELKKQKILIYKGFKGPQTVANSKILNEYRRSLSICDVSELVISRDKDFFPFAKYLFKHGLDTRDGIAYHPSGKIKICLDAEPLVRLNELSKLENGALIITPEEYELLDGEEYSFSEAESIMYSKKGLRNFLLRAEKGISLGNILLDKDYLKKPSENILLRSINLGARNQGCPLNCSLSLNRKDGYVIGKLLDTSFADVYF